MIYKLKWIPILLATSVLGALIGCVKPQESETEWQALFNGSDLTGWQVKCLPADQDKVYWKVVDGAIECNSIGDKDHDYVWLMHDREFDDFQLSLEFRTSPASPGNSGVQIRSRYDTTEGAPHGGWLDGPQVDLHPPGPWRTGLIYDETRDTRAWISPRLEDWNISREDASIPDPVFFPGDQEPYWNRLVIRCVGTQITTTLNDQLVSDYDGAGLLDDEGHAKYRVGMNGQIALQLHMRDELQIWFRDIRIQDLSETL